MSTALAGRVAAVTGAAHGIGYAIAERLAADGAAVVVADLDGDGAHAAVDRLTAQGFSAAAAVGDVRKGADTDAMVALAETTFGGLDILVNNAGLIAGGATATMTDDEWDLVLDVILRGTFNCVRSAARLFVPAGDAPVDHHRKIISISSIAGVHGGSTVNYSAAKAGQIGLTKALAREWAAHKINVNVVAPGRVGQTLIGIARDARGGVDDPTPRAGRELAIPIGRTGEPADIAAITAFLASPDSDYITGQVVEVHGGIEVLSWAR
ncbi:MAG TPA: SDR family NAD(P)-dependent oxidoreductase [Ilumatobacter sp.]|nr:SDR family NAD(P)-dependent oxidoreductase [Ilumatobacter sp.]